MGGMCGGGGGGGGTQPHLMYLIKHTPGQRVSLSAIWGLRLSTAFSLAASPSPSGRQRRPINQAVEDSQGHESQASSLPHVPAQPGEVSSRGGGGTGLSSGGDPGGASWAASPAHSKAAAAGGGGQNSVY